MAAAGLAVGGRAGLAAQVPAEAGQARRPGGRSRPAVRVVAVSLHAVHGAAGRDRRLGRGRLGSPERSMARRRAVGHPGARADDDAMGRHLCGFLPVAGRRRTSRPASADAQPALGRRRVEPGGHRRVRRLLPIRRCRTVDLRQLRVGRAPAVHEGQGQPSHRRREGSRGVGRLLQRPGQCRSTDAWTERRARGPSLADRQRDLLRQERLRSRNRRAQDRRVREGDACGRSRDSAGGVGRQRVGGTDGGGGG